MKKRYQKKLLVAVDGSDRSIQTAQYLSDFTAFRNHEICFFHVFNKVPESYYDLAREPASINPVSSVRSWEIQQRAHMVEHMDQCRQLLMSADFAPDRIKTVLHNRRRGIARDIIAEVRNGYDALVLRRRGMGRLQSVVIGSVAFKLLNAIGFTPLIFAGRKPFNHRVLIAVDGSDNAMRAVAFAGAKLGHTQTTVRILNVLRGELEMEQTSSVEGDLRASFEDAQRNVSRFLEEARNLLVESGLTPENVSVEIVRKVPSRAAAIVQAAEAGEYNTIILGRKGCSRVREFTVGRVSSKVLQIGRELGVWIVQ